MKVKSGLPTTYSVDDYFSLPIFRWSRHGGRWYQFDNKISKPYRKYTHRNEGEQDRRWWYTRGFEYLTLFLSYHVVSCRVVSYRIVSYRIVSYHIISFFDTVDEELIKCCSTIVDISVHRALFLEYTMEHFRS